MSWMAWTVPTAAFFVCIVSMLVAMTLWELRVPTVPRRGILPLVTTRGDRLFISLLTAAFLHLFWLSQFDAPVWWVSLIAVGTTLAILRWG